MFLVLKLYIDKMCKILPQSQGSPLLIHVAMCNVLKNEFLDQEAFFSLFFISLREQQVFK